ncbi:MAG: AAA family ATPase [Caldilineaceae bacterium]
MDIATLAQRVQENVAQVIIGKQSQVELMLVALLADGHVLLEDVPGIGKTTLAKALARSIDCTFARIQFTPDLLPSDVTGINFFNQKRQEFEFRPGPAFSQILLADEINRATPRTQSSLLEAMQEQQITVDGMTMALPAPFMVIATQNPVELEGTFPLARGAVGPLSAPDSTGLSHAGGRGGNPAALRAGRSAGRPGAGGPRR